MQKQNNLKTLYTDHIQPYIVQLYEVVEANRAASSPANLLQKKKKNGNKKFNKNPNN